MKRNIIYEQKDPTAQIIQAPKNEVQRFESGPLRDKEGTIVNLCNGPNGNPRAFRVGGKTYFIAKQTPKGNYLVYDGRVLQKGEGDCEYKYMVKDGKIAVLNGVSEQGLENPMKKTLSEFGIDPDNARIDLYYILNEVTNELQTKFVNKGAVSELFKIWNAMLEWYYPNDYQSKKLKPVSPNTTLELPTSQSTLNQLYHPEDLSSTSGIKYKGGPFKIYVPNNVGTESKVSGFERTPETCRTTILKYLKNALIYSSGISKLPTNTNVEKKELQICKTSGNFDTFEPITIDEVISKESDNNDEKIQLTKKLSPFGILNKELSFNEIKKILYGGKLFLTIGKKYNVGGRINTMQLVNNELDLPNMNESVELKSIIRNKLSVLSENKQKLFISESKVINSRFNIITESKFSKNKIGTDLINEAFDMVNLGMNEKLITEGLMDALKGMFGFGAEGIVEYFKEKLTESLIKKLGFETDEWLSGIIIKGVGNIPVGDWFNGKVFHCDYLVPLFAKTVVEQSIGKAKDKAGLTGGFYDVLRNALVNGLEETSFGQSVERGLTTMLCPYLTKIGEKMGDMFNTMKQKSIS